MSLIKMMLVMVSVAAISKTFGLLRFLLRLSFLAKLRLLPHLLTLWVCKLLMLICILTKNVITSCSVTMMLFLHLEVKPLMTLTTVLYLSCALISGHLAMMLIDRKSGSAGMPRQISYAVFCLKKKRQSGAPPAARVHAQAGTRSASRCPAAAPPQRACGRPSGWR